MEQVLLILDWLYTLFLIVSQIVTVASIIAPMTETKKDDKLVAKIQPVINALTINVLFNKK